MTDREPILRMEEVSKIYGSGERAISALTDVDLEVYAGQVVVIMGPSGSGKTTLLTIAGGLLTPSHGRVWLCGEEIGNKSEGELASVRRSRVGFIYQSFNLLEALTALENVLLVTMDGAHNRRVSFERARELIDVFGLSQRANAVPKMLSDGEKQRVAIARALAKDPSLILADEPTANLDAKRGHEVMKLLRRKALDASKAVVIVSHDLRIREFAHSVLWLEDGQLSDEPVHVS